MSLLNFYFNILPRKIQFVLTFNVIQRKSNNLNFIRCCLPANWNSFYLIIDRYLLAVLSDYIIFFPNNHLPLTNKKILVFFFEWTSLHVLFHTFRLNWDKITLYKGYTQPSQISTFTNLPCFKCATTFFLKTHPRSQDRVVSKMLR